MKRTDFHFELPPELIAQHPLAERSASRLLCLARSGGGLADRQFRDLPDLLRPGDLLVFNDTRVVPARLYGRKASGGRVEVLIERLLSEHRALAQVRSSKTPRAGSRLLMDGGAVLEVHGRREAFFVLDAGRESFTKIMEQHGHTPLPPYIHRDDSQDDRQRYQTVYAAKPGAVAAPTAGLHFDEPLLARIDALGVERASVTLHVGAGTFQPVRSEHVEDHRMHAEYLEVSQAVCDAVATARARGGRVVAVGTTSVRSLETAARDGQLRPFQGDSDIFIYPGYRFRVVDALLTNFHLPESTLLMLLCAFAGQDEVLAAYRHAVREKYRFFSYGDAMWVA